ncbi:glycosyltransferase family 25 protein [Oricola nitratireducens]|uniref:glycosyltransferase family 25 protein n=1 Tax=Oricola nitratireducens TaxID=2775868 RepID=UPI0018667F3B
MNLPVYVINLDRSRERWTTIKETADRLGWDCHRVSAIDGRQVDRNDWVDVNLREFEKKCGRRMLSGEYGCYRSHLLALNTFLDEGASHGLILEDDVLPDDSTASRIEAIMETAPDFDVIRLVNHRSRLFVCLEETEYGDKIGRTIIGPQGSAAAYIVSRRGAERLLAALAFMELPWDVALERFWQTETSIYSVSPNVFSFSGHCHTSCITETSYDEEKFHPFRRIRTALFRIGQHCVRGHHVMLSRAGAAVPVSPLAATASGSDEPLRRFPSVFDVLWTLVTLLFVSAVWFESDVYRFVGLAMFTIGLVSYFRNDFLTYARPMVGPPGILCLLWPVYLLARFAVTHTQHPEYGTESSEGIYLLTALYSTVGYFFFRIVRNPFATASAFILISLAFSVAAMDFHAIAAGVRAVTHYHNNTIHAAIGNGFILLLSLAFLSYLSERQGLARGYRRLLSLLALVTVVVSAVNILVLESKGVWMAVAVALPLLALFMAGGISRGLNRLIVVAAPLAVVAIATLWHGEIARHADEIHGVWTLLKAHMDQGQSFVGAMREVGMHGGLSINFSARLILWSEALKLWAESPIFGNGVSWFHLWQSASDPEMPYKLIHNGFLEIGVRYGALGLVFYAYLCGWSCRIVWRTANEGLIARSAAHAFIVTMVFFLVTNLSNSNVSLALGESYMWFAASFAFYCYFRLQDVGMPKSRTYI